MRQLIVPTIIIILVASVTVIVGLLIVQHYGGVIEVKPKPNFRESANNLNHSQVAFLRDPSNITAAQDYITSLIEAGYIARAQIVASGLKINNPLLDKFSDYIVKCEEEYRKGEGPPQEIAVELLDSLRGTPCAEFLRFQIAVQYGSVSDWNSSLLNLKQISQLPYNQQPWVDYLRLRSEYELARISIMHNENLPGPILKQFNNIRKRALKLVKLEHPVSGRALGLIASCYWSQGEIKKAIETINKLKESGLSVNSADRENLARALVMLIMAPVPKTLAHPNLPSYKLQMCGDLAYLDPDRSDWLRIQKELSSILETSNLSMNWQPNIFPALCHAIATTQANGDFDKYATNQIARWQALYRQSENKKIYPSKNDTDSLVPINDLILGRLILASRSNPPKLNQVESLLSSLALNSPNPKLREQAFIEAGNAYLKSKKYNDSYRCFKSAVDMHMSQEQYALYQAYYVARLGLLEIDFNDKISYLKRAINLSGKSQYRIASALELYPWLLINKDPFLQTLADQPEWTNIVSKSAGLWRWQNINSPTLPGLCIGYYGIDVKTNKFKEPEQWSEDWDFIRQPVSNAELWLGWDLSDYTRYSGDQTRKNQNPMLITAVKTVCLDKYRSKESALQLMLEDNNQEMYKNPSKVLLKVILQSCFSLEYLEQSNKAAQKYNIPLEWVLAIISAETKGRELSESHAGALGLMQIMPDTAIRFGTQYGDQVVSKLHDPEVNITIGTSYLSWLRSQLGSDFPLIAAGYNWGIGNVKAFKARNPERGPYTFIETLPILETEYYVKRAIFAISAYDVLLH